MAVPDQDQNGAPVSRPLVVCVDDEKLVLAAIARLLRRAEENGLVRVCTKPWNDKELKELIREQLRFIG